MLIAFGVLLLVVGAVVAVNAAVATTAVIGGLMTQGGQAFLLGGIIAGIASVVVRTSAPSIQETFDQGRAAGSEPSA